MGPQMFAHVHVGSINVAAANPIYMRALLPYQVHRWGFNVTTVIGAAAIVITGGIVEVDTTAADPAGTTSLGTCTATSSTMALNKGVILNVGLTVGNRIIYPGEAAVFSCTFTGTGVVQVYALVEYLGFSAVDQRGHVTSHPGSTTRPLTTSDLTLVVA